MSEALRVLLVEDEALILLQLEMLLEDAGHEVVGTAVDAAGGVSALHETRPDLAFVDLRLADGSSGLDVARAATRLGGVACVFITANLRELPGDLEGAAAIIAKPFSGSVLEESLAFLEEGLRRPPPTAAVPRGMILAPDYRARWGRAAE